MSDLEPFPRPGDSEPTGAAGARPSVTVVMPVHNGEAFLRKSAPPIGRLVEAGRVEWLMVDDASTDGSAELARAHGARVLRTENGPLGPAAARNQAVAEARGEIVLFVDADVVLHDDSLEALEQAFDADDVVAIFGAYDDRPPAPTTVSQYVNLRHHHVHQIPSDDASTFWSGLGAVRRDAFLAVGGFDVETFAVPSVEDIDLGLRLRQRGGRIRRVPGFQATHLKHWSLVDWLRTDIFRRALPWARMMKLHPGAFGDLNVSTAERLKGVLAGVFFLCLAAALFGLVPWWVPLVLFVCTGLVNRPLFALFARRRGLFFAVRALFLHQVYFIYSACVFVWVQLTWSPEKNGNGAAAASSG